MAEAPALSRPYSGPDEPGAGRPGNSCLGRFRPGSSERFAALWVRGKCEPDDYIILLGFSADDIGNKFTGKKYLEYGTNNLQGMLNGAGAVQFNLIEKKRSLIRPWLPG